MRKRTLKAWAGALVAAALVVAPLVTAGATAAEEDWPAATIGIKGELVPAAGMNQVGDWVDFTDHEATCYEGGGSHGTVTDNGLTVTLKPFGENWDGDHWELLVIKAGNLWNNVIVHPEANKAYASPPNASGNQAEVSHWIVCKGTTPDEEPDPEVITPTLSWTPPSCVAAGTLTKGLGVTWTSADNGDGTTTWTASPEEGTVFADDAQISWVVPNLSIRTNCEVPPPLVEPGEWEDGTWACGDTVVTQTREVSTTTYTRDGEGVLVPSTTKNSETQTRPLTQDELGECPLVPGEIQSVCVGDVPYLGYQVTLPGGFVADSANPVTITFVNPDGEDYVVADQPLSGALLWPGASDGEPKMWPGWDLVDGEYVETDGNFAWTRAGVTVEFDVNPTYTTVVEYPQATALCANPPVGDDDPTTGTPTSTDAEALAVTGGGINPIVVAAGGAALVAGIAVVTIAAYRRRHASMQ
ncbi:hypothetical protein [Microbacterium sp. B35-30]|uniref:hypothetical protein n=1 Tax=Microbacterium sp. B35-30 TaxID=1962642 RepID=UPI0013D211B3|nr:hypothetical protein [Microbacterium sp. B35-30]